MLNYFKRKPLLVDLIPDQYTDIHSHLLPGIDDGAQNSTETRFLIEAVQKFGFAQAISSPHVMAGVWDNSSEKIQTTLNSTILELETLTVDFPLRAAAEYMMDSNFMNLFQKEKLRTLKDNYVLVEMSYLNAPIQLYDLLFELQIAGYQPVLAHPERYSFYHFNLDEYQKLKNAGCLFQLNLLSTVGYYGSEVNQAASYLLKKGMIDFVGSDIHHRNHIKAFNTKVKLKDWQPLEEAIAQNSFFRF